MPPMHRAGSKQFGVCMMSSCRGKERREDEGEGDEGGRKGGEEIKRREKRTKQRGEGMKG